MSWNFLSEFFRNIVATEQQNSVEFNVIDPESPEQAISRITLAYIPPTEELPTADVTLYWTESDAKLFEKRFDTPEDALQTYKALESDLQTVQQLVQANKTEEALNVMAGLMQQYATRTDDTIDTIDNAVPVEGATVEQPKTESALPNFFQKVGMAPADYVLEVARSVFHKGSGPLTAEKLHKYMEAAAGTELPPQEVADLFEKVKRHLFARNTTNPLLKRAGATVQNIFFDSIEELQQYQEKMKELNPDSDQLPGDFDMDLGTGDEDPLGPPSQSFEDAEKEEVEKEKMMTERIEQEVADQVESALEKKVASVFDETDDQLVDAMREKGRTWEEIREYYVKSLKYDKDDVAMYLDKKKGTPGDMSEPELPEQDPDAPKPLVSPEVHDQLLKELDEPTVEVDKSVEIEKHDMAIAEITKSDGEIKKVAKVDMNKLTDALALYSDAFEITYDKKHGLYIVVDPKGGEANLYTPEELVNEYVSMHAEGSKKLDVKKKAMSVPAETIVLSPEEVEKQFPNALMATENKKMVEHAKQNNRQLEVTYFDAIWGRTALRIDLAEHLPNPTGSKKETLEKKAEDPLESNPMAPQEQFPRVDFPGAGDDNEQSQVMEQLDKAEEPQTEPIAGDLVYIAGDLESGEEGYQATFVKKIVDEQASEEMAVVKPKGMETAEEVTIPMHRVMKAKSDLQFIKAELERIKKEAGVWSVPNTLAKAHQLSDLLDSLAQSETVKIDDLESALYNLLGSDALFDDLDRLNKSESKGYVKGSVAKDIIQNHLADMISEYEKHPDLFTDKWEPEALEMLKGQGLTAQTIKADDDDDMEAGYQAQAEEIMQLDRQVWNKLGLRSRDDMESKGLVDKYHDMLLQLLIANGLHPEDIMPPIMDILEDNNFHSAYETIALYQEGKIASKKEAAPVQPVTTDPTIEYPKQPMKKAPDNLRKQEPVPAPEEVAKAYKRVQTAQMNLDQIERTAKEIIAQAQVKIKEMEDQTGKSALLLELNAGLQELVAVVKPLKDEVIDVGDQLMYFTESHEKEDVKWTYAEKLNRIYEKFPETEKYIDSALNGLQSTAKWLDRQVFKLFPKKSKLSSRDIDIEADLGSILDKIKNELVMAYQSLKDVTNPVAQ